MGKKLRKNVGGRWIRRKRGNKMKSRKSVQRRRGGGGEIKMEEKNRKGVISLVISLVSPSVSWVLKSCNRSAAAPPGKTLRSATSPRHITLYCTPSYYPALYCIGRGVNEECSRHPARPRHLASIYLTGIAPRRGRKSGQGKRGGQWKFVT